VPLRLLMMVNAGGFINSY